MNLRAQTVVELMLLLSISVLALAIIYSLYSSQIELSVLSQESSTAKSTVNRIVNSANALSLAGAGSTEKILVEIPADANVTDSNISGNRITLRLSNGSEVFGYADVNIVGEFKKSGGVFVNEGYYANLTFDGQKVILSFDDFEVNTNGIFVSAKQGTIVEKLFTVRNNSQRTASFWVEPNFSYSGFADFTLGDGDDYFTLAPNEIRVIDFNIALSKFSSGNYAGTINVTGQINDGIKDTNIERSVVVSVESFLSIEPVMIFPKSTSFSAYPSTGTVKEFSVCNSSENPISSITWSEQSNHDANLLGWFTWPVVDSEGSAIMSIPEQSCVDFDLNFTVPSSSEVGKMYDGNITVTYADGNTASAYFFVTVSGVPSFHSLFFSTQLNSINPFFSTSTSVAKKSDSSAWTASGELDWNKSGDYSVNGSSWDSGLVAYYKFNSKSGSTVYDLARGNNGTLAGGADINSIGLWDSNAAWFNGSSGYMGVNYTLPRAGSSISFWFKTTAKDQGITQFSTNNFNYTNYTDRVFYINSSGGVKLYVYSGGSCSNPSYFLDGGSNLNDNLWHQVVGTWNVSGKALYIDGVLVASNSTGIGAANDMSFLSIGFGYGATCYNPSNGYFNGSIDEYKVYNRVLSASEVFADYNSFLSAKLIDANVADASFSSDWNSLMVNTDTNFSFGHEIDVNEKFGNGLVGLWHMNGNAHDSSGNGFNGTWGGTEKYTTGLWDTNSSSFDGVNDYIYINPVSSGQSSGLSACGWMKTTGDYSNLAALISSPNIRIRFLNDGRIDDRAFNYAGESSNEYYSNMTLKLNKWTFVCVTYENASPSTNIVMKYYFDGILDRSIVSNLTGYVGLANNWLYIGFDPDISNRKFNGLIEEVAIWNHTLSSFEIVDLYRKGVSRLDLNVYSCSDSLCTAKTGTQSLNSVVNSSWIDLSPSVLSSRYLGLSAEFNKAHGFEDYNANDFWVGSYLKDFNVLFYR